MIQRLLASILCLLPLTALSQEAIVQRKARQETTKQIDKAQPTVSTSDDLLSRGRTTWQRTLYRELDLAKPENAPLAYPQRYEAGRPNLTTLLFALIAEGKLTAYEYIEGEEQMTDAYKLSFADLCSRFGITYQSESDAPANEVRAFYLKERHRFDQSKSAFATEVLALCPILYQLEDYGEVRKPLFWVDYRELMPYLTDEHQLSPSNEAVRGTLRDFFAGGLYRGDIVKTGGAAGRSLSEGLSTKEELDKKREGLERELELVRRSISLPDSVVGRSEQSVRKRQKTPRASKAEQGKGAKAPSSKGNSRTTLRTTRNLS